MKTLVSFDPPYTPGFRVGIVVAKGTPEGVTVLEDATIAHEEPEKAALHAAQVAQRNGANGFVVEDRHLLDLARAALRRVSDLPVIPWHVGMSLRRRVERMDDAFSDGKLVLAGALEQLRLEIGQAPDRSAPHDRLEAMLLAVEPLLFPAIKASRSAFLP